MEIVALSIIASKLLKDGDTSDRNQTIGKPWLEGTIPPSLAFDLKI